MGYIYKIINDNNNKVYIGQTRVGVKARWSQHLSNFTKEDTLLYRAMRKYGAASFSIEQIEKCDNNLLNEREQYWINKYDSYKNGYNSTPGGTSICSGNIPYLVDDQKIKLLWDEGYSISDIQIITKYAKITIREHLKDYQNYSIKKSIERGQNSGGEKRRIPVFQYDFTNSLIANFSSISEAAQKTNIPDSNIYNCLIGKRESAGGFFWRTNKNLQKKKTKIYQYDINNNLINIFNTKAEAARMTGCDSSGISKVCKKKAKICGGYIWKEIEVDNEN